MLNVLRAITASFKAQALFLTGLLCFVQTISAQTNGQFFLQYLDNRSGLSNSAINDVFKDSDNLLWIATWDGLNMYDGSAFHVFNYSKENDPRSIGNNVIKHIAEDREKNIWISTIEGVSRYDKNSGRFTNYFYGQNHRSRISEQEFELAVDTAGNVYCLTQKLGLTRYDAAADSFLVCPVPRHPSRVQKIAFDPHNRLCILNNTGSLEVYTKMDGAFIHRQTIQDITAINNFFISGNRFFFTNTLNLLRELDADSGIVNPVIGLPAGIAAITFYQQHYLVAWTSRGVSVYDDAFRPSGFLTDQVSRLQQLRVTAWKPGTEEILWAGTDGNGIMKIFPQTKPFGNIATSNERMASNRPVRAFAEVNGDLWVGTKGSGIIAFDNFWLPGNANAQRTYFSAPTQLDNNAVFAIKRGPDQLVYIGTDGKGIGVYDPARKKFHHWQEIEGHNRYPEFGSVYAILPDNDSSLWLGTSSYGIVHCKIQQDPDGRLHLSFLEKFIFTNSNAGPANDIIYSLAAGNDQYIWIACRYGGLSVLDKQSGKFKTFKAFNYDGSLSNNDVIAVYHDSKNRIWVGTSYGLNWMNAADVKNENPVFHKFTTANGLPNNTIHAIGEDAGGQIWVSTNKGLARVDAGSSSVSYYQQMDGLQSNEFSDGAIWKDPAGFIFMGGIYGFNYFLPSRIRNTDWLPELLLSGRIMGGDNDAAAAFHVLKPGESNPAAYTLERKDGFFELNVKALSFLNAEKCEYAWFLEGYDKAWHTSGTNGKIVYSNILPGDYRLKIKWSNGEGAWTTETLLFQLTVQQYFWLRWPALLAYAILLSFIGYMIYRYRRNRQEIRNQLAVEHLMRVKEEELHQQQLGFFTNIAHELQTPLTLIMGSAERIQQENNSHYTPLIHQQASRLTYLVQQLLDFRKAEAGFSNKQFSFLDLRELLMYLTDPFLPLSEQEGKLYVREIEDGITAWVDKDKLEKIIFNLLSNAFKHSTRGTTILVRASREPNTDLLNIEVSNTGCVIEAGQLDKLFNQFYVAPGTPRVEKFGTGIGLAFTRQLVTMLNGRIDARLDGDRIIFHVQLPLLMTEPASDQERSTSEKPSYLYRSVTKWNEDINQVNTEEINKRAIIEEIKDEKRYSILIVEDEPGIRYLLNDILKDQYVIYEAGNGREALDLMQQVSPDCIISDVMMPDMDGLELCNRVKNAPATCQIPFVMLSARGSIDHSIEGYESGADEYIAKPFHVKYLQVRVRKLLEYREKLNEIFNSNSQIDLSKSDLPDADKEFISSLVDIIENHLDDVELNASMLEKELSMSKMQLYRKLKTMTNMTPAEFIKHIRLKHAAHMLVSTQLTVSEIFYRTGFNNQSYFYREFRKRYQCAPNEYRLQQSAQP